MKQIALSGKVGKGKFALVDDEDYDKLMQWKWRYTNGYAGRGRCLAGYVQISISMHRQIMNFPKNKVIDHINGDTLDNRKSNLRICTQRQNSRNSKVKIGKFKGVRLDKKVWTARIKVDYKEYHLGSFPTAHLAALAYDLWVVYFFGKYANTNFQHL